MPDVKAYFRSPNTVARWWRPETSTYRHLYERELALVRRDLRSSTPASLLDISCGYGRLLVTLPADMRAIGLDISAEMLKLSRQNAPGRPLVCADAERLPFADQSFASITCLMSLVHFPRPDRVIQEACRVLVPGGFLIADIDNERSLGRAVKGIAKYVGSRSGVAMNSRGEGIFRTYTEETFCRMLIAAGFVVQHVDHIGFFPSTSIAFSGRRERHFLPGELSRLLSPLDGVLSRLPLARRWTTYVYARARKPENLREIGAAR